MQLTDLSIQL